MRTTLLLQEPRGLPGFPLPCLFSGIGSASAGSSTNGDMTPIPCPGHVGRVQGIPPLKPGWLRSLYKYLLGKDQEGLPVLAREIPQLRSPPGATTNGLLRVWYRRYSERGDHDPILPRRPETLRLGLVGCLRQGLRLLGRGCWESRQCRGKSIARILC